MRVRFLLSAFILLSTVPSAHAGEAAALERGTAITDPLALRELDRGRFAIGGMLLPERSSNIPLSSGQLFLLPSMVPVRQAIDREFDRYIAKHKQSLPNDTIGVGDGFDFQLFDRKQLDADDSRFVLAGIVNRMDRALCRRSELRRDPVDIPADADQDDRRKGIPATLADDAEPRAEGEGPS